MSASVHDLLEKHFETAFVAPNGIAKLRELILTLAMQGKLVEQNPNDPPASALLREIEAEKQRLIKEGKIKKPRPLPPIKPEEVPYELPQGWEWVRLGEIGDTNIGLTYSPADVSESGIPVLRSNNIQNGMLDLTDLKRVSMEVKESVLVKEGDLLICARNGSRALVGKTALITGLNEKMAFGAFMAVFRSRVNLYLLHFLNSPLFRRVIDEVNTMTINQITQNNLRTTICPLPPLPEQRRIVERIDQLMARCDALEKLRKAREEKRLAVHAAAISQLLGPAPSVPHKPESESSKAPTVSHRGGDEASASAWRFIRQHFGELYAVKENVAELRKAILQLAVMGRLVPQNPNDPPASELLKEIEAEKQRLIKEGKIKKPRPLPPIKPEEVPYQLPQGWEWVRLGNLNPEYQNGISKRSSNDGVETIVLRLADVAANELSLENPRIIKLTEKEIEKYLLKDGDILITRVNGSVDLVGSFIRVKQSQRPIAYCDHFIRMRIPLKFVNVDYLHIISKGALVRRQIEEKFVTTAGQKTVNQTHITTLVLPVPPLPEQYRIVERIDQLMALCDRLEQQIDAATGKQTELLDTVMAQV